MAYSGFLIKVGNYVIPSGKYLKADILYRILNFEYKNFGLKQKTGTVTSVGLVAVNEQKAIKGKNIVFQIH